MSLRGEPCTCQIRCTSTRSGVAYRSGAKLIGDDRGTVLTTAAPSGTLTIVIKDRPIEAAARGPLSPAATWVLGRGARQGDLVCARPARSHHERYHNEQQGRERTHWVVVASHDRLSRMGRRRGCRRAGTPRGRGWLGRAARTRSWDLGPAPADTAGADTDVAPTVTTSRSWEVSSTGGVRNLTPFVRPARDRFVPSGGRSSSSRSCSSRMCACDRSLRSRISSGLYGGSDEEVLTWTIGSPSMMMGVRVPLSLISGGIVISPKAPLRMSVASRSSAGCPSRRCAHCSCLASALKAWIAAIRSSSPAVRAHGVDSPAAAALRSRLVRLGTRSSR